MNVFAHIIKEKIVGILSMTGIKKYDIGWKYKC